MANIPVERTGTGTPWWVWLLGLLLLAGLIWLIAELLAEDTDEAYVAEDPVTAVDPLPPVASGDTTTAPTGVLTTLDELREARRAGDLYGREVALQDVRTTTLEGDSTFFIEDADVSGDARMLVVLESLGEAGVDPDGPRGSDGQYHIDESMPLDVFGRVERFTGSERQVSGANSDRLLPDSLYINANRVTSDEATVQSQ